MAGEFVCPLTEADWQTMRDICARCEQRKPFIEALETLGIETHELTAQNDQQQRFCETCARLRTEGKL